jgi:putative AlgH/UPF0301 family transcriptional regulator
MVSTDSNTLLQELARQAQGVDPRDAGLETWTLLMKMMGKSELAEEYTDDFDDAMLKEWARLNLLSQAGGGGAGPQVRSHLIPMRPMWKPIKYQKMWNIASQKITPGTLLRASGDDRSPFLLEGQEYHKSIVLVLTLDENVSVGVLLNRPSSRGLDISIVEKEKGRTRRVALPIRFGGQYAVKGTDPLLWLHNSPVLRQAKIGSPIGPELDGLFKCTADDVTKAMKMGLGTPDEFCVVTGVSVWLQGIQGGLLGDVRDGKFEVVPTSQVDAVWSTLCQQEVMTRTNLVQTLVTADRAWRLGVAQDKSAAANKPLPPIGGLGEGYDEEDDSVVFKTDWKLSDLCDDALRGWLAAFLLNSPSLGR